MYVLCAGENFLDVHYLVQKHSLDQLPSKAPLLPYCAAWMDCVYAMDYRVRHGSKPEPTKTEEVALFCQHFKTLTTCDSFTIGVFCSFSQVCFHDSPKLKT